MISYLAVIQINDLEEKDRLWKFLKAHGTKWCNGKELIMGIDPVLTALPPDGANGKNAILLSRSVRDYPQYVYEHLENAHLEISQAPMSYFERQDMDYGRAPKFRTADGFFVSGILSPPTELGGSIDKPAPIKQLTRTELLVRIVTLERVIDRFLATVPYDLDDEMVKLKMEAKTLLMQKIS